MHAAFSLGYEAGIHKSPIDGNLVPPGALVTFVQKGIQYLELEANLSSSDTDIDEDFSFIQPLDLITKDVYELQKIIKEKKEKLQQDKRREKHKESNECDQRQEQERTREKEKEKQLREKEREKDKERKENKERERGKEKEKPHEEPIDTKHGEDKVSNDHEDGNCRGPEPMDICTSSAPLPVEIPSSDVAVLEGHTSEVFVCAWSPVGHFLPQGRNKLNTDTCRLGYAYMAGFRGVFRDDEGNWIKGYYGHIGRAEVLEAELWDIYRGLILIHDSKWEGFSLKLTPKKLTKWWKAALG